MTVKTNKTLILDLDDTIFRTRSMDPALFQPFIDHLSIELRKEFGPAAIQTILNDLWEMAWDAVMLKHNIPRSLIMNSVKKLDNLKLNLSIAPYDDYSFIRNVACRKILVTTSLTSLQRAKIKALDIENDFHKIVINDPFEQSKTKLDIFRSLMEEFSLSPYNTIVVGDNPHSEISAGNTLGMVTVQILRDNVAKGDNASHYIRSFDELKPLLTWQPPRSR